MSINAQRKSAHAFLETKNAQFDCGASVNNIQLNVWWGAKNDLNATALDCLLKFIKHSVRLSVYGGGRCSQKEAILSVLYKYIFKNTKQKQRKELKNLLCEHYFFVNLLKTDLRKPYAKKAGGPKSRKRYQKSYR